MYDHRKEEIERTIDDHLVFLHGEHNMNHFEYWREIDGVQ